MKYITSFEEILQVMIILLLRERLCWPTGRILIAPQTSLSKGRVGVAGDEPNKQTNEKRNFEGCVAAG